jgi:A/G-specific adenine glycosylase
MKQFHQRLRAWFVHHARDLPWRRTRDAYAVWLSEIMLQQTQVATVRPYFERFLAALPTIAALAQANEEQVLRLWEGLGYYRRARQLQLAARQIVVERGGVFPRDPEAVRQLPGIGRYTAGAILSIAFDARQPILEANTSRLWSRLVAYRGDPASTPGQKVLWAAAEAILPSRGVGLFNQALMELGSMVCVPREPRCDECPVASLCRSRELGIERQVPTAKAKPPAIARREAAVVVRRADQVLLVRCPEGQRWAGLWDFPRLALQSPDSPPDDDGLRREVAQHVRRQTGVTIRSPEHLATIRHGVTRFRITLECYVADYRSGAIAPRDVAGIRWVAAAELDHYPLNSTARKLARLVMG